MYSKVSVIAMIAPSPDWFVGVDSIELCGNDGEWKDSISVISLPAWDAGTDSGTTFAGGNVETMPQDVVKKVTADGTELTTVNDFAKISFVKYTAAAHSISGGVSVCLSVAFLAILRFLY